MRVRFAKSTGCPYGQFVITTESDVDIAIQSAFLGAPREDWDFWIHGVGGNAEQQSFNFGWVKRDKETISVGELRRLGFEIPAEANESFPIPDHARVSLKSADPELETSQEGPPTNRASFGVSFDIEWE